MSGKFPPSKPDWSNVEVIHRGTLPPRSYFFPYQTEEAAIQEDVSQSTSLLLSGTWKFHHANNPFDVPNFSARDYDASSWSNIQVPGIWQLQGWGNPHYTNVNYPIFVDPPHVPFDDNQTGCYVRTFSIDKSDDHYRLRFDGVDSAFHVWVNGHEIGYSQGSRNASEFDVSLFLNSGENTIAVQVYQYCDGTYLEDQDQWRFSGIFRDVFLLTFPKSHIVDFHVQTLLDDEYGDAEFKVDVDVTKEDINTTDNVELKLLDKNDKVVASSIQAPVEGKVKFSQHIDSPLKWTAETPNLYKLLLTYNSRTITQNVGFRRIEIKNGIYLVNGQRIVFRGANRHEHHPEHGRAVPYEFMKNDLLLMKKHNINAIRTCHQPSDPRLYALADELGLWIMDEADLECHGFTSIEEAALSVEDRAKSFEEKKVMINDSAGQFTSDNPEWKDQYVDRARQLVMRDKNHPSVIMWSLGNEAFYGRNFQSMYDEIRSIDQSRPIHYEGDFEAKTVDLFSQMYPRVDDIIKFAQEPNFTKPLVLCEFVHAMGNGPGGIKEYIDAFYKYPRLQGGWVWEWANHGLKTKNSDGEEYYAYGGDFGDVPNDYNFILDGVLFSDHTPTPGLIEYCKAIEPVQVSLSGTSIEVTNRYDIVTLDHLKCEASLVSDGSKKEIAEILVPTNVQPHQTATMDVPVEVGDDETYLQLDFRLKEATNWAEAGHLVSSSQLCLVKPTPLPSIPSSTALTSSAETKSPTPMLSSPTPSTLQIKTPSTTFQFSLPSGRLISLIKSGTELLHDQLGPELTIYRALTDNDRPQDGQSWREKLVHLTKPHVRGVQWSTNSSTSIVTVQVTARIAPPVLNWYVETTTTYVFTSDGSVHINCKGLPHGPHPDTLPRIGFEFAMPKTFDQVSWFGRGPGESYKDKKLSQHFGNWRSSVDELWVDYEFPQEGGNRTDTRWVKFESSATPKSALSNIPIISDLLNSTSISTQPTSLTAKFGSQQNFSFNASHYTTKDVDESKHPYELHKKKEDYIIVRLDADHHGLGTGSCGPKTMEKYALKTKDFEFDIFLQ